MTRVGARHAPARPEGRGGMLGRVFWVLACGAALSGLACKGAESPPPTPPGDTAAVPPAPPAPPATDTPTPDVAQTATPGADTPSGGGCNAAAPPPGKRYVGRSSDDCARIRYVCEPGESQFTDDCGCGCEKPAPGAQPAPGAMPGKPTKP